MNVALWIIAAYLAVVFLAGGVGKLALSREKILALPGGAWVAGFSAADVKALGVVDLLAAAGLVLPAVLGIAPVLVPIAAVGVVLLMAGAVLTRLRHGSEKAIIVDVVYLVLAGVVAWGRFGPEPFTG